MAQHPETATHAHTNRLINETSPYLLQHAHNPVDWRPWGNAAFEAARQRGVPIFLSIGYSTCYWCHVMERESFENEDIAAIMNEHFVCIKVDREERPDVDDIYMAAVQTFTGSGGWPMSVWLTPPGAGGPEDAGLRPFYAGTYFPPDERYGRASFPTLLRNIHEAWTTQRQAIIEQADRATDAIRDQLSQSRERAAIGPRQVGTAVGQLLAAFDEEHGGFGPGPNKFPQPVYLELLMAAEPGLTDADRRSEAVHAIRFTLDRMALGGMYDQVGGGFHRYSTDPKWLIPHFEKMLYDNGQLASLYARAFRRYDDPLYERIVRETLDYVLHEMTDEAGAFHSAQDAEVNAREGLNYLWTVEQLRETLDANDTEFAAMVYGLDQGTNFQDPHHADEPRRNVLYLVDRPEALAEQLGLSLDDFLNRLDAVDSQLYDARMQRDQPATDDKIITSWNGLMIAGFADGALTFQDRRYLDAAARAADFILTTMRDPSGGLLRTFRNGTAGTPAFLEDYAALIQGLITLHLAAESLGRPDGRWLTSALDLLDDAYSRYADESSGVLYDTLPGQQELIVRTVSTYDGAVPCGNSMMLHNLIDLHEITSEPGHIDRAITLLSALSAEIARSPVATVNATRALHRLLESAPDAEQRLRDLAQEFASQQPVQIFTTGELLRIPKDGEVTLPIEFRIRPGHHINAHEPGVEGLIPLQFKIDGGRGVELSVAYPPGTPLKSDALHFPGGPLMVHEGTLRLDVKLRRTQEQWRGEPRIIVVYQVCTETECLAPQAAEIDVELVPDDN